MTPLLLYLLSLLDYLGRMKKFLDYKEIKVSYLIEGEGEVLVFLHGYLEAKEIWKDFSKRFSGSYKVICIDVPGHGESGVLADLHKMDEMAAVTDAVLQNEKIDSCVLFGHSMGGYVVMSFVENYPDKLKAYCLFHSTCFADNEEKKDNRDREIALVICGRKNQIIHTNIPKGFADLNLDSMGEEIQLAKEIAMASSNDGTVALLRGMKDRKDHSDALKRPSPPALLIWGKRDNYISEDVFTKLVELAPHASIIVLKNSGHMGFIEEPDLVFSGILNFLSSIE
jgi:pimeloyl-ACP methyl ester carboxylesterase